MNRLRLALAAFAAVVVIAVLAMLGLGPGRSGREVLRAGFAAVRITPPVGTRLSGFGDRDFRPDGARGAFTRPAGDLPRVPALVR